MTCDFLIRLPFYFDQLRKGTSVKYTSIKQNSFPIPGRHEYVTSRYVISSLKHGRLLSNSVLGTDISHECLPEHSL